MSHPITLRGIAQRLLDLRGEHSIVVNAALLDIAGDLQEIANEMQPLQLHGRHDLDFLSRKLVEYQEVKDGKR